MEGRVEGGVEAGWRMLDLQLDEINVISRMDIGLHERRLREIKRKSHKILNIKNLSWDSRGLFFTGPHSFANLNETIIVHITKGII